MSLELAEEEFVVGCHNHQRVGLCEEYAQRLLAKGYPKGHAVAF